MIDVKRYPAQVFSFLAFAAALLPVAAAAAATSSSTQLFARERVACAASRPSVLSSTQNRDAADWPKPASPVEATVPLLIGNLTLHVPNSYRAARALLFEPIDRDDRQRWAPLMWGRGNTREFAEATPSALEEPFSAGGGSLEIEQSLLERAGWLPPGRGVRIKLQAINPDLGAFVAQQEAEVVQLLASRSARAFYSPDCDYVVDPERFILRIAGDGTPAECAGPVLYRGSTFGYRFGSICFGQMSFDFTDNSDDLTIQHETLLRAVGFVRQLLTPH